MKGNKLPDQQEIQNITYGKLVYQALPEMWSFQLFAGIILSIPIFLVNRVINLVVLAGGGTITSANADLKSLLLSWRFPAIMALFLVLILSYAVMELFANIHLTNDILLGKKAGVRCSMKEGLRSLRRFLNPAGFLMILYILIFVPLSGIGFSLSLTRDFHIPGFIMETIKANPLYMALYVMLILFLVVLGFYAAFTIHAVLIDDISPLEGFRRSIQIIKENGKWFFLGMVRLLLILGCIQLTAFILFYTIPDLLITDIGKSIPRPYYIDLMHTSGLSSTDSTVIRYRVISALAVLMGAYLMSIVALLCNSYFMLRFTRWYYAFTGRERETWPARPMKKSYLRKVRNIILIFVLFAAGSVVMGCFYNQIYDRGQPVKIIAHRAGGKLASENSIEGLNAAIEHGCYASEIDVQRTADGYYIINHDNSFKRLTGVAKKPEEMTLAEIRKLRIKDTTGSGKDVKVATLNKMLDVIKGHEVLYIELKGATADRRMVDDVVSMVRKYDCVDEVALISLNYDVIDYAETTYPEFMTGTLFFAGLGDVTELNCDLLIMEEEAATDAQISRIQTAGKKAVVWTVNTKISLKHFLDSSADAIITDEIVLAEDVQKQLDSRTEYQLLQDRHDN